MSNLIKLYSNLETILSKEIMSRGKSPSKTCPMDKSRHSKEMMIAVLIVVVFNAECNTLRYNTAVLDMDY